MSKFNLNSCIKVTLYEEGIDIFESYVKNQLSYKKINTLSLVDYMNSKYKIKNISRCSEIRQIVITIQLLEFMNMFSNTHKYLGSNTPFNMNIEIDDKDLIREENE